jgi:serine/threonine protein kinase/HD-like signal output (HDOD) protein
LAADACTRQMAASDLTQNKGTTMCLSSKGRLPTPPVDALLGQTLGSFRVISLLGEGGMGRVYLAEHVLIGRRAAIKVLASEIADNEDFVSRFFTEARAVNDIRHPNIVEVTDFGTFGKLPYIVMELLDGETLEQRLARVRLLDAPSAARLVAQVAAAVGAGHEHGMVHRDLKPANIFLRNHPDYPDFVKVLDFGIAKLVAQDRNVQHHTEMGALIGTPAYMSPEQCLGDTHLDHRSDIYSLGVVLYQTVTGRLPFTSETAGRLIMSHVQETPPPPQSINPSVSSAMSAIVLRAMAKKPDQRFASMREFRDAILVSIPSVGSGTHTATYGGFSQALTPPPVLATMPSSSSTLLSNAATTYSPTPAPNVRPSVAPARLSAVAAQPQLPAHPPSAACAIPAQSIFALAPAPLATDKHTLVEGLVEALKSRTEPDGDLDLPLLPRPILRCLDLLGSPDFSFGGMAALVTTDARLTSQLVQVANTSGATRTLARSTEQAISRLGAEGVRTGLLEIALRTLLETTNLRLQAVCKQPWLHALAVATISQRLMQAHGGHEGLVLEAYRGGLFHDAGKPVAATLLFDIEKVMTNAKGRRVISDDMLVTCLERCHSRAGARLGRAWGLSPETSAAIEEAGEPAGQNSSTKFSLSAVIRLANALSYKAGYHTRRDELDRSRLLIDDARRGAGFDEETCHRVLEGIKDAVSRRI